MDQLMTREGVYQYHDTMAEGSVEPIDSLSPFIPEAICHRVVKLCKGTGACTL